MCIFGNITACDCCFLNGWNTGPAESNHKLQEQQVLFSGKHYFCVLLLWSLTTQESVLLDFNSQTPCKQTLSTGQEEKEEN